MYTVSDVVDMGAAHELILDLRKVQSRWDDDDDMTMDALEYFDE